MRACTFQLRLLEPVLVARAESGEENSAVGLPFVPGSTLRGALVARFLERNPIANLATDARARRLFLDGTTCFLNAYPCRDEGRLLPTPASWFTEKEQVDDPDAEILDQAVGSIGSLLRPTQVKSNFCHVSGASASLYTPPRQVNVHISLLNPNHRDEPNQVYRYDALAEGEVLAGVILTGDANAAAEVKSLLSPDELRLGGAHTAGYGRVRIEAVEESSDWEEYVPGQDPPDGSIVVTLLSDTVLRGRDGQLGQDLTTFLADQLGIRNLCAAQSFRSWHTVGGYNRKWGLPLTQSWALRAGSVYVYPPDSGLNPDDLRSLFAPGIGERRAEGCGRVAVNWHTEPVLQRFASTTYHAPPPSLSEESKLLARGMAQRRLRMLLERRLAEEVNRISITTPQKEKEPKKNAQFSRVRNAAQDAASQATSDEEGLRPILDLLDSLKDAKEQFAATRIGDTPLLNWIQGRARERDVERQLLGGRVLPQVAGERAELLDELRTEFTARLIDGVMKKAIQQNQKEAR